MGLGLNGLMWWIDRWRKSTAFTDMTLEEQGAYRNLLDEACLRGGYIPNDDRILARACGDVTAWKRVKEPILAHFVLTPQGYRNETLLEVLRKTTLRIEKQKRYRDRKKGNGGGNDGGNESGNEQGNETGNDARNDRSNKLGYLDPDPDREPKEQGSRRAGARVFAGKRLKVSQAQHQVVLDELGASAERLNLVALYAEWDAELVASGATFDVLTFVKARATAALQGPPRSKDAPTPSDVDWFEECQQLHGGDCGGRLRHHNRVMLDGEKARRRA